MVARCHSSLLGGREGALWTNSGEGPSKVQLGSTEHHKGQLPHITSPIVARKRTIHTRNISIKNENMLHLIIQIYVDISVC